MNNQRGWFRITGEYIHENPWVVLAVMSKVIVLRAEYKFMTDTIEYEAISPEFRHNIEGCVIPQYHVIVHTKYDGDGYLIGYEIEFEEA